MRIGGFMYIIFLILFLGYFAIISFIDVRYVNKAKNMVITEKLRIKNYREGIILNWIPALAVFLICLINSISLNNIGLRQLNFEYNIWFNIILLVVIGGYFVLVVYQVISYFISPEYRKKAKEQLDTESEKNHYNAVMNNLALPRTKNEKLHFFGVSLTAGISEEIVFRGFLFFVLQNILPNLPMIIIPLITCAIFGVLHIYQGIYGIIKTSIAGILLGYLYLVTGSIIPGIIIHFLLDFSAAFVLSDE